MFDIGPEKLLVLFAVVVVFLGPKEIPGVARTIGSWLRHLRSLQDTLRTELGSALALSTDRESTKSSSHGAGSESRRRVGRDPRAGFRTWPDVVRVTRPGGPLERSDAAMWRTLRDVTCVVPVSPSLVRDVPDDADEGWHCTVRGG